MLVCYNIIYENRGIPHPLNWYKQNDFNCFFAKLLLNKKYFVKPENLFWLHLIAVTLRPNFRLWTAHQITQFISTKSMKMFAKVESCLYFLTILVRADIETDENPAQQYGSEIPAGEVQNKNHCMSKKELISPIWYFWLITLYFEASSYAFVTLPGLNYPK